MTNEAIGNRIRNLSARELIYLREVLREIDSRRREESPAFVTLPEGIEGRIADYEEALERMENHFSEEF